MGTDSTLSQREERKSYLQMTVTAANRRKETLITQLALVKKQVDARVHVSSSATLTSSADSKHFC